MKALAGVLLALFIASPAFATLSGDEMKRLNEAKTILADLRASADKGIPEDLWERAKCVIVIPSMKKAAFIIGGEYGSGVMSCRQGTAWTAPVFMQLAKGSWGLQVGAEQVDLVLLVMNERGVEKLLQDKVSLGADASVTAGPVGRTANAATDAQLSAEMLSYSRSQGLFAGIDLSGGVLKPDKEADARGYGANVDVSAIVHGTAHPAMPAEARSLTDWLSRDVRATTGVK